jgi:histidinol phosphatase-like PHP family hydrolase
MLQFGVSTARRGWVEASSVLNTWKTDDLLNWLKNRE